MTTEESSPQKQSALETQSEEISPLMKPCKTVMGDNPYLDMALLTEEPLDSKSIDTVDREDLI